MATTQSTRLAAGSVRSGASSLEYAAMLGLVIAGVVGSLVILGKGPASSFNKAANQQAAATKPQETSSPGTAAPATTDTSSSSETKTPAAPSESIKPAPESDAGKPHKPEEVTPPAPLSPIFVDTFDGKKIASIWSQLGNSWSVQGNKLRVGHPQPANGEHRLLANHAPVSDFVLSVDAHLIQGNGYGLFFRVSGETLNGYSFQYDPGYQGGQFIVRKWVNGYELWPPIAAAAAPKQDWYGGNHNVTLKVQGNSFAAMLDDVVVLTGQDSTYQTGITGLRTWYGGKATFDNYTVTPLR